MKKRLTALACHLVAFCALAQGNALDEFWDSLDGGVIRTLPLSVVPQNSFIDISNVSFDHPDGNLEKRILAALGERSTYNVITLTLRSIPDLSDAVTMERAKLFFDDAHARGIKVLMDIDVRISRFEFLRRWPEHHAGVLRVESVAPTNGTARFSIGFTGYRDHMAWGSRAAYEPLEAAIADAYAVKVDASGLADPATRRSMRDSLENVSVQPNLVSGCLGGMAQDERLVVAVRFKLLAVDPCSPHITPFLEEVAERYRKLGADGAMRDEWGFPPMRDFAERHTAFPFTDLFADAYARKSGGRSCVRDCMLAVQGEKGAEGARRKAIDDINSVIYERISETEREFYALNKKLFGPDTYVTKHPTWHTGFCASEFLHNGFDWWSAQRDWAQSDEAMPVPCVNGMAKKFGGPVWMNEGYGPNPEHYVYALWRYALCGGRMVYHRMWGTKTSVSGLPPDEETVRCHTDIIDLPGAVRAQARLSLLNTITRSQIDCPAALVFGHARVMNWLDPAFTDGGVAFAHGLSDRGYLTDMYPSSELAAGTVKVDGDGWIRVGQQRYKALVLYRLDNRDFEVFSRLVRQREIKTRLFSWDCQPSDDVFTLASASDTAPVLAALAAMDAVKQSPLTKRGLTKWSKDHLPAPDGTLRLIDGTVARIKGCSPSAAGDAIEGTLRLGGKEVAYSAEGLFAVRLDAEGQVEALAAGGLRKVSAPGFTLTLDTPEDVVLVRRNGKWRGLWQTKDTKAEVPSALKGITPEWTRLRLPPTLK